MTSSMELEALLAVGCELVLLAAANIMETGSFVIELAARAYCSLVFRHGASGLRAGRTGGGGRVAEGSKNLVVHQYYHRRIDRELLISSGSIRHTTPHDAAFSPAGGRAA